jgi:uncharacterized delta-60 repeat protein
MSDRIARVLLPLALLAASAGATAQTIPDTAFGGLGTGFVNLPLNQGGLDRDIGNDMKTRPDGRIVIVGSAQTATGLVAAVYQLTPDGLPDPTFGGGDGRATFADPNAPTDALLIHALAIQSDGKIVLAGTRDDGSSLAMRINADGTALDAGFGSGGFAPVGASEFRDVAIDNDGRIVCVGEQAIINPIPPHDGWTRIAVTRLTTTGALDTSS